MEKREEDGERGREWEQGTRMEENKEKIKRK